MQPRKTIIGADYGRGLEALRGAEGTGDQLVHSKGVRMDFPGYAWVFLSGFAAADEEMRPVGVGDIRVQTRHVLEQMKAELEAQGGGMDDIVRVRVYVAGFTDERFRAIHEERAKFFSKEHYPASTLVEVKRLVLPELLIEIDSEAIILQDS